MPAPVPQPCQPIADQLAALEATDQTLRTQLANLVGADAWAALAQLGQTREQISLTQAQLDACISNNSAALQANLFIFDVGGAAGTPPSRIANLWEIGPAGATLRETSAVSGNAFSFKGPLPAQFAISVLTTGVADVVGPDFLSGVLAATDFAGKPAIRLEAVLLSDLTIRGPSVSELIRSTFTPVNTTFSVGGIVTVTLSVLSLDAALGNTGIELRATGQLEITGALVGGSTRVAVSGSATLSLTPSGSPASVDFFDVINVSDVTIDVGHLLTSSVQASCNAMAY